MLQLHVIVDENVVWLIQHGKERKKKQMHLSRIYVGEEYDRWNDLKTALRLKIHIAVLYSPQLVPLAHVLSDVSLNNAAI